MKKLLLSVFAIAAMASCMQDEVISQDQQAIDFGTPFVEKATKADDPTYGDPNNGAEPLTSFNVYGTVEGTGAQNNIVNIFNGILVQGEVGDNTWSYDAQYKQYWIEGGTYKFAAVVDAVVDSGTGTVALGANKLPSKLVPETDNNYLKDLLYAFNFNPEFGKVVDFNFEHLLAKAYFTVNSTTEGNYYYNVEDIKINNYSTGTYTIGGEADANGKDNGAWETASTTDKAYGFGNIELITKESGAKTNDTQVLLYPTNTAYTVEFTVRLLNNMGTDTVADDVELRVIDCTGVNALTVNTPLVKGNAYNFTLKLEVGAPIQFTVSEHSKWDSNDVPVTLQ